MQIDPATANAIVIFAGNHPREATDKIAKRFAVSEAVVAYLLARAEATREQSENTGDGARVV